MNFKFPLATIHDQDEIDAMQNIINSGNFTMGKQVASLRMSLLNSLEANML